jgi:hypothetical protein
MLVLLFLATSVLAICVISCASSSPSFSGLQCVVLDAGGPVAPGLLPLASPAVEDDAATTAPLPAELPELVAANRAPLPPAADLR